MSHVWSEIIIDPVNQSLKYTFAHNVLMKDPIFDQTSNLNNKCGQVKIFGLPHSCDKNHFRYKLVAFRHGQTHKNKVKELIKSASASELSTLDSVESDKSYDTDELIQDMDSLALSTQDIVTIQQGSSHLIDKNSALNDKGVNQARMASEYINKGDNNVHKVITSDVMRAMQTGKIISNFMTANNDITLDIDSDLHFDDKSVKNRSCRLARFLIGMGEDIQCAEDTIVIVTHNQTLDALYRMCYGFDTSKQKYHNCALNEAMIVIDYDVIQKCHILIVIPIKWNDVTHLIIDKHYNTCVKTENVIFSK
jgi:broad specificity phosphatase PhoE